MKIHSFDLNIFVIGELSSSEKTYLEGNLHRQLSTRTMSFDQSLCDRYIMSADNGGCVMYSFLLEENNSIMFNTIQKTVENIPADTRHYILNLYHTHNYSHFLHQHCVFAYSLLSRDNTHVHYISNNHSTSEHVNALKLIIPDDKHPFLHIVDSYNLKSIKTHEQINLMSHNAFSPGKFSNIYKLFLDYVHDRLVQCVDQDLLIFVIRGKAGEKRSRNSYAQNNEISNILQKYAESNNLKYYEHYGSMSTEKQINLFQRARIVVGFTGAGMANTAWVQRGNKSHVIEFGAILEDQYPIFGGPAGFGHSHLGFWGFNLSQHFKSWNIIPYTRESTVGRIEINLDNLSLALKNIDL